MKKKLLTGIAVPFNSFSVDLGFFERFHQGAFAKTLKRQRPKGDTIFALTDHDYSKVIGSVRSGALRLEETTTGLAYSLELPDTTRANDLYTLVQRGDIKGLSISFGVRSASSERWSYENGELVRDIYDAELFEVSAVANPAFLGTTLDTRMHTPQTRFAGNVVALKSKEDRKRLAKQREIMGELDCARRIRHGRIMASLSA